MCSEFSFLNSGFGTYAREILSRLYKTNKYTIAEFASYGFVNDPRDKDIDWIFYANGVKEGDPRHAEYVSRGDNQFGRWRFEKVLLDFRPDIVIDVRDYWMSSYQAVSPLRKYFHWILMPTVDSEPQQEEWIDTFLSADAIFTYSDWGADVLARQSSQKINYISTASPGVDLNVFKILDKTKLKDKYGLAQDSIIIGSVMRNQKRKLIPELFISFRKLLDQLEQDNPALGEKTYLYLHTSYPDMGWDIPELLKDNRLSNRVLFTYSCKNCQNIEVKPFSGPQIVCQKCVNRSVSFPSVSDGISSANLAEIYNLFDLYVQYSICEGFGMPQVEAGACGIPVATVDYSAMCDIIHKLKAYPIPIKSKFKELETKAYRVYPDNDSLVSCMKNFISLPKSDIMQKRQEIRSLTEEHYNWDHIAKIWENYFDKLDESGFRSNWDNQAKILNNLPDTNQISISQHQNFDTIFGICKNYLKDMSHMEQQSTLNMLKDCDYGFSHNGMGVRAFDYTNVLEHFRIAIANNNVSEQARSSNMQIEEDFIVYAKMKEQK